jgi:hypothetical protein
VAKGRKTGGRTKGIPNAMSAALKDVILGALSKAGGELYLLEQSTKNPVAFMALVGRVLPLQVKEGGADPMVPKPVFHDRIG